MSVARAAARWVTDWRNIAAVIAAALVAYLGVFVVSAVTSEQQAIGAARAANISEQQLRQAAIRRVNLLLAQIAVLNRNAEANAGKLAELQAEVAALQEQVRQSGGKPVVVVSDTSSSRSSASPSPTPTPRPSPSHTPTPPHPTPTPSPSRTCAAVICLR